MKQRPLAELLDAHTIEGSLFTLLDDKAIKCHACAHRCELKPGQRGICKVRFNQNGKLHVPWGYVAAANIDPIEKKPFMHFLPGEDAMTFGMLGCNFHCDFCQNWLSSQALRDPASESAGRYVQQIEPQALVSYAQRSGAQIIASSYNEPLITSEWALEIFGLAREVDLYCVYVSNGFATPEVLKALQPVLQGFKIDLKCMSDENYRKLGGNLKTVLDSISLAKELGMWVEVVTLVIPEFNDSTQELWDIAHHLATVSVDIPWHVSAFYPTYKHTDAPPTSAEILLRAADIGQEAGLRYVYAGNLPGRVGSLENTYCPSCNQLLIERRGYVVHANRLVKDGNCPACGTNIAGLWG